MHYTNAIIFTSDKGFVHGGFSVKNGRFENVLGNDPGPGMDLEGAYVLPGLVDIHIHGAAGADFSDGDYDGLVRMAAYLAGNGITSFAPTGMSLPYETLDKAFRNAVRLRDARPRGCSRPAGIHMEGPFFSEKRKGAQNGDHLRPPDIGAFRDLYENCGGMIRLVDVAPELPGSVEFIRLAKRLCKVSVAHTDACYEQARDAFEAGATHLTHLFNAMPPIHHRSPGVIGAASENANVVAELICDGTHVHPSAVRMAFRLFPGRVCLISDSLRCCGMPDGRYELGGQEVFLRDGTARLSDGTLAGAASNLYKDMLNAISYGIPAADAIRAATILPAWEIGCDRDVGSIENGKLADFLICGENLDLRSVYMEGDRI